MALSGHAERTTAAAAFGGKADAELDAVAAASDPKRTLVGIPAQ